MFQACSVSSLQFALAQVRCYTDITTLLAVIASQLDDAMELGDTCLVS